MSAPWTCVGVLLIFLSTVNSQEILNMETFQQGEQFTVTCNLNTMHITDADEVLVISMRRQTESDTAPVTIGDLQPSNTVERAALAQSRNWDVQGTSTGTGLDAQLIAYITGTTCNDAGNYTCAIVYKSGDSYPSPAPTVDTISATARVQDMTLSVDKIEITYVEQEVINFTCRVDGPDNLVIQWYSQCAHQNYEPWPFANDIQRLPPTDIPSAACGEKRHASVLRYTVPLGSCFVQCRAGLPNQAYSLQANMSIASIAATTTTPGGPVQYVNPTTTPAPPGIKLTSSTDVIVPALTRDFYIMCSFPKPADLGFATIISMVISKGVSDTTFKDIASVNIARPLDVVKLASVGANITGKLDPQDMTILRLDWAFPSEDMAGVYSCEVNTLNSQGHPVSVRTSIRVTSKSPDTQSLVNQFRIFSKQQEVTDRELLQKIRTQENQLQQQNVTITNMMAQLREQNVIANVTSLRDRVQVLELFDISAMSAGKQYLVSRIDNVNIYSAEALCNVAGGHLADIKSSKEFDVIKRFMKTLASTNSQFTYSYFSPTQENHPGRWVYRHSGEVMTYTGLWGSGYPKNNAGWDCAILVHSDWQARNYYCKGYSNFNFICERAAVP